MSGDDVSPESLAFSPLSLNFKEDYDDRPSLYAYRKFSVPVTSSASRASYSRRRSRNSPLGTPVRPPRSSRRTSLPAIHFHETSVSTLHVEPGVLGQPNHALVAHLKDFSFGEPPIQATDKYPEESLDGLRRPSESASGANGADSLQPLHLASGAIEDVLGRPDTRSENRKSDININYIFSEDIPVAVTDWEAYNECIQDSEPLDLNDDTFVNHIQRVEPDSWTFMRDRRLSFLTDYEHTSKSSDDARGERWWCEPLGRFIVCRKATAGQSRTSTEVVYNRLKIRRLPLDPSSPYIPGPPVLVHRHSKTDAFSIYRYFGKPTPKQRMDTSFTIILGMQRTLSAHYLFRRNKRSRQAVNPESLYSHKRTRTGHTEVITTVVDATGVPHPSRPSSISATTNLSISQGSRAPPISIRTTGLPKMTAKVSPGSRGVNLSPISLPSKPLPETPSPQRKSFFRSLLGTFSFNKEPDTNRRDETEDIIDCCRHVGLLPAEMPRTRHRTVAFSNLSSDTMCMLLPLWLEPEQSSGADITLPSHGDRSSRTHSLKNRKYLLVYYPPVLSSSSVINIPQTSAGRFNGTFCAYGRVLSYRDLRDAAIVLPERGLCVSSAAPVTPVQLHQPDFRDDPVLAIATKEQGIMICHYSFEELGLADKAGSTAGEMGKVIAEMVWCGCITLMNFRS